MINVGARAIVVACGTFVAILSCGSTSFVCEDDDDCVAGGANGVCEANGGCSFPDERCPSGRRYGAHSRPEIAGTCVDDAAASSGETTSSSSTAADELTATLATTASSESAASTSSSSEGSSEGPSTCPPDWWDCAWTRRVELVIAPTPEPATDVPVLALLGPARFDYAASASAGADLRFVGDGVVLPHEIEAWNAGDVSVVWLAVPAIGGDAATTLYLYHGNPDAEDAQDPDALWGDPFAAVWHLSSTDDSSGNGNHGVASEGVADVGGWLGGAKEFFAVDDRIDIPPASSLEDLFFGGGTVSAWARADTFGGTNRGRIADSSAGAAGGWMFYLSGDKGGDLRLRHGYEPEQSIWGSPPDTVAIDGWHHLAITFDVEGVARPRMYIDGIEHEAEPPNVEPSGMPRSDVGNGLIIGNSDVADRWFDGRIDELRLERGMRGPAWIALQVQSMRDELVDWGAIEALR